MSYRKLKVTPFSVSKLGEHAIVGKAMGTSWVQSRKKLGEKGKENNLLSTQRATWAKLSPGLTITGENSLKYHLSWSLSLGPVVP